jgi:hypothetical protein
MKAVKIFLAFLPPRVVNISEILTEIEFAYKISGVFIFGGKVGVCYGSGGIIFSNSLTRGGRSLTTVSQRISKSISK